MAPLGQLGAVRGVDEGQVSEARRRDPQGLVEQDLLVRVGEVVLAPNDVGDAHFHVIADDHVVIEGRGVGAQQREVLDVPVTALLGAVHLVVEARTPVVIGDPEADRKRFSAGGTARRDFLREVTALVIAQPGPALGGRLLALGL